MNGWAEGLARAMAYLEAHLTEDLDPHILAGVAGRLLPHRSFP